MTGQHEDVYFKYIISGGDINHDDIFRIDKFTLNQVEYKFESDKTFMYGRPYIVSVYACKGDEQKFKPWLLQVIGNYYDNSSNQIYRNYFFEFEDGKNWKNKTFISLNVPSGSGQLGKIELKEDTQAKNKLTKFKSVSGLSSASPASGYVYKESGSTSSSSVILPSQLASYLGQSDKKNNHTHSDQSYTFTSVSSESVENISFAITIKRRPNKETEKTVIYELKSGSTSFLTQKGSTTTTNLSEDGSGSGSSCNVTVTEQAGGSTESVGGSESPQQVTQEASSQASEKPSPSPSPSSGTSEKSQSSSNLPAIVCGAVFGSGGLIGGGILIYKCIG
ncbi:hypothetical protein BdWA1_000117 [Babesia duncani]|uniref:Uncharacterized protein n=1 Tax=Babesia duncani TaxID=323732 RepID=A0AAD9PLP6_9APIC|nr:hypothetical protein BdWA1_000117 [Babesia duncani]